MFIVIENFAAFAACAKNEEKILTPIFSFARHYNILFLAGYDPDDTGKLFGNTLPLAFHPDQNVLLFGGRMDKQNLVKLDYAAAIKEVLPKFGRCMMGYRGKTYSITMPCGPEKVETSEEDASIF